MDYEKKFVNSIRKFFKNHLFLRLNDKGFVLYSTPDKRYLVRLLIPLCISLAKKANIDSNELINRIKNRKQILLQQPNIQTLR